MACVWHAHGRYGSHVLRLGGDGLGGSSHGGSHAWAGRVHMAALYSQALDAADVDANYAAGLDNSVPVAGAYRWTVDEDACTPLPDLAPQAADWDVDAPAAWDGVVNRGQTLAPALVGALPTKGGLPLLFTDAACATPATSSAGLYESGSGYFRGRPHEHTAGDLASAAPYATVQWQVGDGYADAAFRVSPPAALSIVVRPVNDAPVGADAAVEAYMGVTKLIALPGTDVDHAGASLMPP